MTQIDKDNDKDKYNDKDKDKDKEKYIFSREIHFFMGKLSCSQMYLSLSLSLYLSLSLSLFGQVMSPHHSDQMSQRSQVSRIAH